MERRSSLSQLQIISERYPEMSKGGRFMDVNHAKREFKQF